MKIFLMMICFSLLITSCSNNVISRNSVGHVKQINKNQFWGVRKKIAILPLFNESPYGGDDLAENASNELFRELSRTAQFIVNYEYNKLFGSSKEIYNGGGAKLISISKKAKNIGVNFVLYGRIVEARIREKTDEVGFIRTTKSYSEVKLEIRIFDINSNKEIYNRILSAHVDDKKYGLFKKDREEYLKYRRELLRYTAQVAIRKGTKSILGVASRLDWVGRIAKIIENKIYVNAGRVSGLNVGDILKVLTVGQEIYDLDTGSLIGVSKGEVKGTIEVIDYIGPDGAVAIVHAGGAVQVGDFVKLY